MTRAEINRLARLQIKHHRARQPEKDLAEAIEVAELAYEDEPERLRAAVAELRGLAADIRRHPKLRRFIKLP